MYSSEIVTIPTYTIVCIIITYFVFIGTRKVTLYSCDY